MVLPVTNGSTQPEVRPFAAPFRSPGTAPRGRSPVWARVVEPYAAGTVLDDLVCCEHVESACARILARFAVTRCVLLRITGELDETSLRVETAIARAHLARIARHDPERTILNHLLIAARDERPSQRLVRCASRAAEQAARVGHEAGAFRLFHLAFMLALSAGWRRRARKIAGTIAGHAERSGAAAAAQGWRRLARSLRAP